MGITTKNGDAGTTSLAAGVRLPKDHIRIEALGALDELSAALGMARAAAPPEDKRVCEALTLQKEISCLAAVLAGASAGGSSDAVSLPSVARLESHIARLEAARSGRGFVYPGASAPSAAFHVARAVCRRAERRLVSVARAEGLPDEMLSFMNRLSDLLFLLAETEEGVSGADTTKTEPICDDA